MIYGSVCSGIEAASVAWHPLGWRAAFLSEIEAFPRAVLSHHYPTVPLHGDFTTIEAGSYEPIDLLVGGTPCQDFSIAGLRAGLAGDRGNLTLEFVRLIDRLRPRWVVWDNVPGILSIDGGRAFGSFLGGLAECRYGFAYRVLDAQYFGVPQRRRRVFVVGYLGDWRPAGAVLFESQSLRGDSAPRREAGQNVAGTIKAGAGGGCGPGPDEAQQGLLVAPPLTQNPYGDHDSQSGLLVAGTLTNASGGRYPGLDASGAASGHLTVATAGQLIAAYGGNNTSGPIDIATALSAHGGPHGRQDFESETFIAHALRAEGFDASEDGTGRGTPLVPVAFSSKDHGADAGDLAPTLRAMGHSKSHANSGGQLAVAFTENMRGEITMNDTAASLQTGGGKLGQGYPAIQQASAVRRLIPRECERLQGFPDDYTLITYRNKPAADGPRYKALGNSMAVPCMRWIGERIEMVDAIISERKAA